MLVALIARDKVGHIEVRKANRADHILFEFWHCGVSGESIFVR